MAFPRVENLWDYTLDMEEWLIAIIIYEPERYPEIRHLTFPKDCLRPLNQWFLQAIENLYALQLKAEMIHPIGIVFEVLSITSKLSGHAKLTHKEVASYLYETLTRFPPLTGGNLAWAAGEVRRLAEERGGGALPLKHRRPITL